MGLHFMSPPAKTRRIAVLSINADHFLSFLRRLSSGQPYAVTREIPKDARVVGLTVDAIFNTVQFYVESETFPECPEGRAPDEWDVTFSEAAAVEARPTGVRAA